MERVKIKKLLTHIPGAVVRGSRETAITGITSNSRQIAPGNLFIAKKGLTVDGAKFIPEAVAAGAAAILTDLYNPFFSHITQIIHPEIAAVEAAIAREFYGDPVQKLRMVGITGTNGKTTTSYLIQHLLGNKEEPCGLIGTIEWIVGRHVFPSERTTPDLLQNYKLFHEMVAEGCTGCVMEVSSHALDQGRVSSIEFDVGVFTNLTQDHLDYHGTMEAYGSAKAKLFTSLKPGQKPFFKTAVVNADSPATAQMIAGCPAGILDYGVEKECALQARNVALTSSGLAFDVCWEGALHHFTSPLIGRYNVYNLLAATGVALAYGIPLKKIAAALKHFSRVPGRLERVVNPRGLNIFVDYAHTDDALANVLVTLNELKKGRLITVFGCGGNRDREKRPKMGAIVEQLSDRVIVTSDNPRNEDPEEIIRHILAGLKKPGETLVIADRAAAIQKAVEITTPDDILLIAGKGHETTQIFSGQTIAFDDRIVALKACAPALNSSSLKAVVFDCDGTLVDSEHFHYLAWKGTFEEVGHFLEKEFYQNHFSGVGDAAIVKILSGRLGIQDGETLLKRKHRLFEEFQTTGVTPIAPTVAFVRALFEQREKWGLKLAVASGARKVELLAHLKAVGLDHCFEVVLSGRDDLAEYTDAEGTNKPKPYVYLKAAQLLGVPPSGCIAIEDSSTGIASAVSAGYLTIAVPNAYTSCQDLSQAHMKIDSFAGWKIDDFLNVVNVKLAGSL